MTTYTSPSQAIEDSKKKKSPLQDNSWIRRPHDEDEAIDQDPNFGRTILGRYKSTETVVSSGLSETTSTRTSSSSTVQALSKRYSTSQDELNISTTPTSGTYTRNTYTSVTSPKRTTTVTEQPKTSTTKTTFTENGKITETTTTISQKSPSKTDTFMDKVFSDKTKGSSYTSYSPTKKNTVTETTVTSTKDAPDILSEKFLTDSIKDGTTSKTIKTETVIVKSKSDTPEDKLYDTLIPLSIKGDSSQIISSETITVKSSSDPSAVKSKTTTRTSSTPEDQLYDTLLPRGISNPSTPTSNTSVAKKEIITVSSSGSDSQTQSSTTRTSRYSSYTDEYPLSRTSTYTISSMPGDINVDSKSYSYSKPDSSYEYTSITSPSSYSSTTYKSSRTDEILGDTYSKSSFKSVYASPERTVLEKDLCSSCRKPFTADAKIILDDMKINCHASCFKCEVCNSTLGHLKAGDSMWIYKRMVHCDRCFEVTRDKWRR